jgi:UDP-glucose 4-epimerase
MGRYLVTGGAGFIGAHLVDLLLSQGQEVRVMDNLRSGKRANLPPGVEFVAGDVRDLEQVRAAFAGVDGCFHLAAIASVHAGDAANARATNLDGAINVFEAARRAPGAPPPIVYASSAAVYGESQAAVLGEDSPTQPVSAYGADKLGCETHASTAARAHGLGSVGLRFFNVYGPRQDPRSPYSGVISIFAANIAAGSPITIHGDGQQTRDFVYVSDVRAALWDAMAFCRPGVAEIFNVCTGRELSINGLADEISRLLFTSAHITHGPARADDIRRSVGDPRRLAARLGSAPRTPLDVGLAATLQWLAAP